MITTILLILITTILTAPANVRGMVVEGEVLSDVLNWHNIKHEVTKCGIKFPEIVMLQIRLETGGLQSRICKECNNLVGMKYPRKRETTAVGRDKSGAAVYDTWQDCIRDYRLWQDYMYWRGDYYDFLHGIYATDVYYVSKLKRLNN